MQSHDTVNVLVSRQVGLVVALATLHPAKQEVPSIDSMEAARMPGLAPSPQSEAVASELQELSLHPAPEPVPLQERKNGETGAFVVGPAGRMLG